MQQVDAKVAESAAQHDDKKLADALLVLSQVYGSPDVPAEKSREVIQVLDQMAGMVIYSRKHTLESPYLVQSGDTMDRIAERYQVPSQLLTRINGIRDPQNMPPGKELKVIQGPFSAQISTDRSEMTIMLKGRYAGRFPVALNSDLGSSGGIFTVREKRMQAPPVASAAVPVTSKPWIDLGNQISIQGTSDSRTAGSSHGTIWLSDQDMDDVYGILSVGSNVVIQR